MCPCQVRCELNSTIIEVSIRGTDTHGLDLLDTAHLVDNHLKSLHTSINIVLYLVVPLCLDSGGSLDLTT